METQYLPCEWIDGNPTSSQYLPYPMFCSSSHFNCTSINFCRLLVSVTEHGICSWSCVFSSSPPRDWARLCFHHHQWWFTIQKDIFIIMKFAAGHTQFILLHFSLYIITSISYIILWWCQSQPLAAATMTVQCIYVFCVMPPWHVWCHHGSAMYVFYVMPLCALHWQLVK